LIDGIAQLFLVGDFVEDASVVDDVGVVDKGVWL